MHLVPVYFRFRNARFSTFHCSCISLLCFKTHSFKMSMSGVEVDAAIAPLFNDMKLKSTHKFMTFKIEKKKKVVVDVQGEPKKTESKEDDKVFFDDMKSQFTDEPRYVLYDFGFTLESGRKLNKIAFIFWCPDTSKIGDKMIYASTKDTVKKSFTGLSLEFQANDMGDMDYDAMSSEVERKA